MSPVAALTPAWIGFEVLQLILFERYLGVKQIRANLDPRRGQPSEAVAFTWIFFATLYAIWMAAMLYVHAGVTQVVALLATTLVGYSLRRICGMRWVLVVLTFEGAIRIGMLISLGFLLWRAIAP
jgi:hypothetical protein